MTYLKKIGIVAGILIAILIAPSVSLAAGQIISPLDDSSVTDTSESFSFQTDNGANQWVMFDGDGNYFCGDSINGYGSGISRSFTGWATACGTTILQPVGAFHIVLVSSRSGYCTTGGNYDGCIGSAMYLSEDVCVNTAGTFCGVTPGGTATTTITLEGATLIGSLSTFIFYASLFFLFGILSVVWILVRFFK